MQAGEAQHVPGSLAVQQMIGTEVNIYNLSLEEGAVKDGYLAFFGDGILQLSKGFIEQFHRCLRGDPGGDISQGCIAILSDFGRQIVFDFESGEQRRIFKRQLYMVACLMDQQKQTQSFLEVQVYGWEEKFGVYGVPAGLGIVIIWNAEGF